MSPLTLPPPLAAYFAADIGQPEAFARCFTEHATVKDEGHSHTGRQSIQAWKAAAATRYAYTATPLALEQKDGVQIVTSRVVGNFPGSPVDLRYRFRLDGGLIAALEITA